MIAIKSLLIVFILFISINSRTQTFISYFLQSKNNHKQLLNYQLNKSNINNVDDQIAEHKKQKHVLQKYLNRQQPLKINQNFDFLFQYQFVGHYQASESFIQTNKRLFSYLDNISGKIALIFFQDDSDFDLVYAISIVLFDPKYQDEKAIVFQIRGGQVQNQTWSKTNQSLSYSMFYNQRPVDDSQQQNITFVLTVLNTKARDPQLVDISMKVFGLQGSSIEFSASLKYNDDLSSTLWYCLFVCTFLLIEIICAILLMRQIIIFQPFIARKFSLTTLTLCTIFDFYQMLIYIQKIVQIQNSSIFFLLPGLMYIIMFLAIDTPLIFLIWKSHYMREIQEQRALRKQLMIYYAKLYGTLFIYLFAGYFFYFSGWFILLQSLFIIPQIIRNYRLGNSSIFSKLYIFGFLGIKIIFPTYERLCPQNRQRLVPMIGIVIGLYILYSIQIVILYLQYKIKPRWFIPKKFQPNYFNYFVELQKNQQNQQIQCTICILSIFDNINEIIVNNQSQLSQPMRLQKVKVMKTPCNHYFHQQCLSKWLQVKLECPTCRKDLPPLL